MQRRVRDYVIIDGIEEDSTHKTQEDVATPEKAGTAGGVCNGDHSCHERSACIVTKGPQLVTHVRTNTSLATKGGCSCTSKNLPLILAAYE